MDKEDFFDEAKRIANFVANMSPISEYPDYCCFCKNHIDEKHGEDCIYIAALKLFDLYEEDDTDE